MKIKNTVIKIIKGDTTRLNVDAIVSATDRNFVMTVGLSKPAKRKKSKVKEKEPVPQKPVFFVESIWTKTGSPIKAKHVIQVATLGSDQKTDENKIRQSCANALKSADELNVASVALPALGCQAGEFPVTGAAKIMTQEILRFLRDATSLKEIVICLNNQRLYAIFDKTIKGYVRHIQEDLSQGPYVTADAIIEFRQGIVLIERSNPPYGWALPGGFLDYGESLEETAVREAKEETGLDLKDLRQFHTYSRYGRDPRFHTVTTVFIAKGKGTPRFGDDAKGLKIVKYKDLLTLDYAFDHKQVVEDYLKSKKIKDNK